MKQVIHYPKVLWLGLLLGVCAPVLGQSLKDIAAPQGFYIGNIMSNEHMNNYQTENGNIDAIVSAEYNILVLENGMKMDAMLPNRPADPFNVTISDINTTNIDNFVNYANQNGMRTRGHAMIWYNQAPQWLQNEVGSWSAQNVYDFSRTYITALATYCAGKIDEWDVLNEAINDNGNAGYRTNTWYDIVDTQANSSGQMGYLTYFGSLFSWARAADANAKLFYNDYSIEQFGTSKNAFMRQMVKDLVFFNTPIDAVGFQSHFELQAGGMSDAFINQVGQTMDDLATANLDVAITELDLRICNGAATAAQQRSAFRRITEMAFGKPNCNTLLVWGVTDGNSWIPAFFSGCGDATLHTASYQQKEAYFGVQDGLTNLANGTPGGGTGGNDNITSVSGPDVVAVGSTATLSVGYEASQTRDVVVFFQLDTDPWTVYETVITAVGSGSGTLSIDVPIPASTPVADAAYQFQVLIAPTGGQWNERLDNQGIADIDAVVTTGTGQAIANGTYYIKKASSNAYINAPANTSNLNSVQGPSGNSTKWTFTHLGDEEYE
ncbi:MAG TPA: hypothetical protein DCE41_37605, partial [Cytophagales bacterium]|nr:hypothetical protein [Cytophagales bacterium]